MLYYGFLDNNHKLINPFLYPVEVQFQECNNLLDCYYLMKLKSFD